MPTFVQPRGRGRPPTHPVDRLRTRLWFHLVKLRSGLPSAYAIEMTLDRDRVRQRSTDVARPQKWDQYRRGEKVPDDQPGPRNAIDQAEGRFAGTAIWFRSPIWPVLRGEKIDRYAIDDALRRLQPEVVQVLFEAEPRANSLRPDLKSLDDSTVGQLVALNSFDVLVAAVLLAALAEDIASPPLRETALDLYLRLQPGLRQLPELEPFYPELFAWIDQTCKHWIYVTPARRLDTVIFWQGMQEAAEKGVN